MKKFSLFVVLFFIGSWCLPLTAPAQTANPQAKDNAPKASTPTKNGKLPEGSLVRAKGTLAVYLIQKGKKNPFPNAATFVGKGYKWENVKDVDPAVLNKIPLGKSIPAIAASKK